MKEDDNLKWVRVFRWSAFPLGILLIVGGVVSLVNPPFPPEWFFRLRAGVEILLGAVLFLPFAKWGQVKHPVWPRAFFGLVLLAVFFAFLRVIGVLFEARVVEAAGGELGLPAWSGTLIFLVLAQIPIILFLRFPDEMD